MMYMHNIRPEAKNMKQMTFAARIDNLNEVLAFIDEQLEEMNCPMKVQMQIDVAVEEIFVNIASYAYKPGTGDATITITKLDTGAVSITFEDSGIPYNPLEKEDPDITLPADERKIGGLGIYMVKKSMDKMRYEYRNRLNILTIEKKIK